MSENITIYKNGDDTNLKQCNIKVLINGMDVTEDVANVTFCNTVIEKVGVIDRTLMFRGI